MSGQRNCRRATIRDAVIARILDGTYPPGTRLKEMALATEFGCSQAPVREALRELEASGLAVSEPYCGTRVLGIDAAELREAYELKAVIEERAAELAVPCEDAALQSLAADLAELHETAARLDYEAYAVAALSFHRTIVQMSGNRTFLRAWDALHWQVRSRVAIRQAGAALPAYAEAHVRILSALRTGDGIGAGRALRSLVEKYLTMLGHVAEPEGAEMEPTIRARWTAEGTKRS